MRDGLTEESLEWINHNPDLPVLAMVSGDVVEEDYQYYHPARFGFARIDRYLITKEDNVLFRSDNPNIFETLAECLSKDEFENLPKDYESRKALYEALPWTRAVILCIEPLNEKMEGWVRDND